MKNEAIASAIARSLNIPHVVARILVSRGFTSVPAVHALLSGNNGAELNPFTILGMKEAVKWTLDVRDRGESIFVYGDYDLDGLSSVSLLKRALNHLGFEIKWRLPSRFGSGYGLSVAAIDEMIEAGAKNILTVDTGITANEEIAYAKSKGLHVMVIDHHQPSGEGLPVCDVLLDPHQEGDSYGNVDLCGVGVAYKFICALYETLNEPHPEYLLELVALGTLADLVPMTPENRYFTHKGLAHIWDSPFPGVRELCRSLLQHPQFVTAQGIMFKVAPQLNAPGRIERPDPALAVLLCDTPTEAKNLVEALGVWNQKRKNTENEISEMAIARVHELYGNDLPPVLLVDGENWHVGVIGIVAAKLTQEFDRPAAVISIQPDGIACASARAIPGFNWHKALFECRDLFTRWGGHSNAAGFSLAKENIDELRRRIIEFAKSSEGVELDRREPVATIDVAFAEIDETLMLWLARLEPLIGNFPAPVFRAKNVRVKDARELRGGHLGLELGQGLGFSFKAIAFGMAKRMSVTTHAKNVTVDFEVSWNVYNGRRTLQLQVKDIFGEQ